MEKSEVYDTYTVNAHGTIADPGKFEGESWISPIVYNWYLDGDNGNEHDGTSVYLLSEADRAALELPVEIVAVSLFESEQGFVSVDTLTEADHAEFLTFAGHE
jgi:hypothetical protein